MQSLLQLLLIPQGTLFGQIMFLSSFIISWVYNLYLSSLDKEKIQQQLLFKTPKVGLMSGFELSTRPTAAVFATLVLRPHPESASAFETVKFLKCSLPKYRLGGKLEVTENIRSRRTQQRRARPTRRAPE
ncbi:hypothetical protein BDR05DRAFT_286273 [Suillus weaverae]|nr:hypothetical protein BDR05DRAFT_286273 [Suillus weaverae]